MKTKLIIIALLSFFAIKMNAQCNATFTSTLNANGTVTLTCTGPNNPNMVYNWYQNSSVNNAGYYLLGTTIGTSTFTFSNNPDTYNLGLTVQDQVNNCYDSSFLNVTIPQNNIPCQASFSYTQTPSSTAGYNFITLFSTGTNSSAMQYNWYLMGVSQGGSFSQNATYNFQWPVGTYNFCLSTNDPVTNCSDTICQNVNILENPSSCSAAYSYAINPNGSLQLNANNITTLGMNYTWIFAGNTIATGANATLPLPAGIYNICLATSLPSASCTDTVCQIITIPTIPCQAGYFIYPDTTGAPHTYIGINTSTGTGLSYLWSWGDGTSSTGQYPSHTYASAGNYVITLVVNNGNGCIDTFSSPQTINKTTAMYSVNFGAVTSVNSVAKELATIYPNPAKDNFTIKSLSTAIYQVEIMNLNGSILKSVSANGNQAINISTLANNIYILKITNQDGSTQFAKLIKD